MASTVELNVLAEMRSRQAKTALSKAFEPFPADFDTADLHIRLWRAASPRDEIAQRKGDDAAAKYLAARKPGQAPTVLFDSTFYLDQLPWFVRGTIDPLDHYLRTGWSLGLSPHLAFDTSHLAEMLGIKTWTVPPLLAYFEHESEVSANPLFDADIYGQHVALTGRPYARLFEVFIGSWATARAPFSKLFSLPFYGKFELVARYGNANPLLHYLMTDIDRRRDPNPMLHNKWYDTRHPAKTGQAADPLIRFAKIGLAEGYLPNPFAAQELKLHDMNTRVPRELLLQYLDVSAFDRQWYDAGASFGVLGRYVPVPGVDVAEGSAVDPLSQMGVAESMSPENMGGGHVRQEPGSSDTGDGIAQSAPVAPTA